MQVQRITEVRPISLAEIKEIGTATGPCISILIPGEANSVLLRQAISQAEQALSKKGVEKAQSHKLMGALRDLAENFPHEGKGLAVYCAPDVCRAYHVAQPITESVTVGDRFNITPLIPALNAVRDFYLLALSQKHTRLLRCTDTASSEVELPPATPKSLWGDSQTDKPDHRESAHSSAGPDQGGMKGVSSSTNTESEDRDRYLAHFYKHVSEGVNAVLKDEAAPLVIAGVDYEIAAFRRVNVYPNLVEEPVHGSADGLKGGELHSRALEAVRGYFETPLKNALARYDELGSTRGSSTIREIVKAAHDGRILDLIISEGAQYMGKFDEATDDAKGHKQPADGDEDLLNFAALQTLLHASHVYVVPPSQTPHGAPAVAVFRY